MFRVCTPNPEMNKAALLHHSRSVSPETEIAVRAALCGGDVLLSFWRKLADRQIREKGKGDLVTAADLAAETAIVEFLKREMPAAAVVAEEGALHSGDGPVWYVDPLDGTTNFVQQFPVFAVSVGLAARPDRTRAALTCGAVFNPVSREMFYAASGRGSFLNGVRLIASAKDRMADAVIATGFPQRHHDRIAVYLRELHEMFVATRAVRRAGAAALDLCWTAQGLFDGFWEHHLSPWDIAAGALIVEEAGGVCSDLEGGRAFLQSGNILGANSALHPQMLDILRRTASA